MEKHQYWKPWSFVSWNKFAFGENVSQRRHDFYLVNNFTATDDWLDPDNLVVKIIRVNKQQVLTLWNSYRELQGHNVVRPTWRSLDDVSMTTRSCSLTAGICLILVLLLAPSGWKSACKSKRSHEPESQPRKCSPFKLKKGRKWWTIASVVSVRVQQNSRQNLTNASDLHYSYHFEFLFFSSPSLSFRQRKRKERERATTPRLQWGEVGSIGIHSSASILESSWVLGCSPLRLWHIAHLPLTRLLKELLC